MTMSHHIDQTRSEIGVNKMKKCHGLRKGQVIWQQQ